jgi:hypothetical protein
MYELVEMNLDNGDHKRENGLAYLSDCLIKKDLQLKLRAASIAAKDFAFGAQTDRLLDTLFELEANLHDSTTWIEICGELLRPINQQKSFEITAWFRLD